MLEVDGYLTITGARQLRKRLGGCLDALPELGRALRRTPPLQVIVRSFWPVFVGRGRTRPLPRRFCCTRVSQRCPAGGSRSRGQYGPCDGRIARRSRVPVWCVRREASSRPPAGGRS